MTMKLDEAQAWLRGERSMANMFCDITVDVGARLVQVTQADAAMLQQAFWVCMAHRHGCLSTVQEVMEDD